MSKLKNMPKVTKILLVFGSLILILRFTSCAYMLPSTNDYDSYYRGGFKYLNCERLPFAKKYQYSQPYFMENTKYLKVKGVPKEKFVVAKNTEHIGFLAPPGGTSYNLLYAPDIKLSDFTIKSIQFYAVVYGYKSNNNYKSGIREIICETTDKESFNKFWQTYNKETEFIEPLSEREHQHFGYDENGNAIWLYIRVTFEEYKNIVWDTTLFWHEKSYGHTIITEENRNWYFLDSSFNPYIEEATAKIEQGEYNK